MSPLAFSSGAQLMNDRRCRYCQRLFQPSRFHPQQAVCSQRSCQQQRQRDYHREKIASDVVYRQVGLESPRKWREAHPGYWKDYRQSHPQAVERNRRRQQLRDQRRRLAHLANNNLAPCQVLIFSPLRPSGPLLPASCQQQPSGAAVRPDL